MELLIQDKKEGKLINQVYMMGYFQTAESYKSLSIILENHVLFSYRHCLLEEGGQSLWISSGWRGNDFQWQSRTQEITFKRKEAWFLARNLGLSGHFWKKFPYFLHSFFSNFQRIK